MKKSFCLFLIVGALLALALVGGWIWKNNNSRPSSLKTSDIGPTPAGVLELDGSGAPAAWADMTIPYLRNLSYASNLEVGEIIEETEDYKAYLASYLSDGNKILGILSVPTAPVPAGGWPGVVFVHGYLNPETYETNGSSYRTYWQYLAKSGLVVFKIDLRGHGDSEGNPSGAYFSSDYVVDTLNARAALQSSDLVNADKIGLWGHSMAGNVVLRAQAARPEIPAVAIWAGAGFTYADLAKYRITDHSYVPPSRPQEINADDESTQSAEAQTRRARRGLDQDFDQPFWQLIKPTNYLADFQGSIQLHHAVDDEVVSVDYSRDLNQILDQSSVSHEYFEYETGGHNINGSSFEMAMQRTAEFFQL